jgi:hypothetical protein
VTDREFPSAALGRALAAVGIGYERQERRKLVSLIHERLGACPPDSWSTDAIAQMALRILQGPRS